MCDPPTAPLVEALDRGVVSLLRDDGVLVSWRWLLEESDDVAFDVLRDGVRINDAPVVASTVFLDVEGTPGASYQVVARSGPHAGVPEAGLGVLSQAYLTVPLQTRADHLPNDGAVGDLDGDGRYEIILKQEVLARDPAEDGVTGQTHVEAYALDGTLFWRIDLGFNIREGPYYTPFIVYDLDGDGAVEVVLKTSDGTVDGAGQVLGDPLVDWRDAQGRVLAGPESLSVFAGATGRVVASHAFEPERGDIAAWGDTEGNRVDRLFMGVAHLDGVHASLITVRGMYDRIAVVAWDWSEGQLRRRWTFDTNDPAVPADYRGQGNHQVATRDIDGDGRDEVIVGGAVLDDDGTPLYATGWGVGRVMHVGDLDPLQPGLEIFGVQAQPGAAAVNFRSAADGTLRWLIPTDDAATSGPVRAVAADIVAENPGEEFWVAGGGLDGIVWNAAGEVVAMDPPSANFAVWWDGDLSRELLDGIEIDDFEDGERLVAEGCSANNDSLQTPVLVADILGDWREEVLWRTEDGLSLRVYLTPDLTDVRFPTLMHDPVYRAGIAMQNIGDNQPAHTGQYLGTGMAQWGPINASVPCPR